MTPEPVATPTATPEPTPSPILTIASEPKPTPTQTSTLTVIETPSVLDRWPFGAARSVVIGNINQSVYAFVGVENGVLVLDIATPATPEIIGSFPTSYSKAALHLEGTLLLVPLEGSIVAYDVGIPTSPNLLSTILTPPVYGNLVMYDNHVFVSAGGVSIVDWSDRTEPRLVGALGGVYGRLAVWKNYLLVASDTEGLVLFDIIDPGKPKRVTSFALCSTSGTPSLIAVDVAVVEDTALVAAGNCGLSRIDLSDPSQPRKVTHIPEYTKQELQVRRVIAQGNTAIVSTSERLARYSYRSTLSVIAIGENEALHILGEMEGREFLNMAFAGYHLYATYNSLEVIDISNLAKPSVVTSLSATEPYAVAYDKGRALVVGTGLWVFDVSSPTDIRVMSYTSLPSTGYGITIKNDIAFISAREGLLAVDVAPDIEPRIVNALDTVGRIYDVVVVKENIAFAISEDGQVWRIQLEGMVPTGIGPPLNVGGSALRIQYEGGFVFIDTWHGIWLMEPADVEPLQLVAFLPFQEGPPLDVAVLEQVAYVAGHHGIRAVDISNPAQPRNLNLNFTYGKAQAVDVSGQLLVAALGDGFSVFNISDARELVSVWSTKEGYAQDIVAVEDFAYGLTQTGFLTIGLR